MGVKRGRSLSPFRDGSSLRLSAIAVFLHLIFVVIAGAMLFGAQRDYVAGAFIGPGASTAYTLTQVVDFPVSWISEWLTLKVAAGQVNHEALAIGRGMTDDVASVYLLLLLVLGSAQWGAIAYALSKIAPRLMLHRR